MITAAAQRKRPTGGVCNDLLLCIFTISGWKACEADSPHCFFPRFSIPKAQDLRKATRSAVPRTCYNHIHADREKNKNNKTDLAWLGSKKKASNVCLVSQDTFWPSWKQNKNGGDITCEETGHSYTEVCVRKTTDWCAKTRWWRGKSKGWGDAHVWCQPDSVITEGQFRVISPDLSPSVFAHSCRIFPLTL